jgi:hypothetical protein
MRIAIAMSRTIADCETALRFRSQRDLRSSSIPDLQEAIHLDSNGAPARHDLAAACESLHDCPSVDAYRKLTSICAAQVCAADIRQDAAVEIGFGRVAQGASGSAQRRKRGWERLIGRPIMKATARVEL